MHKYKTLIFTHYITYLSFQLLHNHQILQHINYSFLYLKVLVKPELSMHVPMGHQNISIVKYLQIVDCFVGLCSKPRPTFEFVICAEMENLELFKNCFENEPSQFYF